MILRTTPTSHQSQATQTAGGLPTSSLLRHSFDDAAKNAAQHAME